MSRTQLMQFLRDEDASALIEYMILVSFLGLGWIAAMTEYRDHVVMMFNDISRTLRQIRF